MSGTRVATKEIRMLLKQSKK